MLAILELKQNGRGGLLKFPNVYGMCFPLKLTKPVLVAAAILPINFWNCITALMRMWISPIGQLSIPQENGRLWNWPKFQRVQNLVLANSMCLDWHNLA